MVAPVRLLDTQALGTGCSDQKAAGSAATPTVQAVDPPAPPQVRRAVGAEACRPTITLRRAGRALSFVRQNLAWNTQLGWPNGPLDG
jgi:hypothetical protein